MKKRKSFLLFLLVLVLSLSTSLVAFSVTATENDEVAGLFASEKGVTLSSSLPTSTGITDTRTGLLITAGENGTSYRFKRTMAGEFSMDFRVFSEQTFSGKTEQATSFSNPYADVQRMSVKFTDENDKTKSFTVVLDAGSYENIVAPNAYVSYEGVNAGIYYSYGYVNAYHGGVEPVANNATKKKNANGLYTVLYGASFCNMTHYAAKFHEPISTQLAFDPNEMLVYSYGYSASGIYQKMPILDLDAGMNDYRTTPVLKGFENYSVEITFDKLSAGKSANMLIYTVNGDSVADGIPNEVSSSLFVKLPLVAEIGTPCYVDEAYSYDIKNGISKFGGKIEASVSGYMQEVLTDENGTYVVPDRAGVMSLSYASGMKNVMKNVLVTDNVFNVLPVNNLTQNGTYGVGEEISFDYVVGQYEGIDLKYTLYADGTPVSGLQNVAVSANNSFVLDRAAEYTLEIAAEGFNGKLVRNYTASDSVVCFVAEGEFADSYTVGDNCYFPTVKARLGSAESVAKVKVLTPSGNYVSADGYILLSEAGRYSFEYTATVSGRLFKRTYNVDVIDSSDPFEATGLTQERNVTSLYYDTVSGMLLSPTGINAVKATYKTVLNLEEAATTPIIEFYSHQAEGDGVFPTIVLTDAHNKDNYVTVEMWSNTDWCYRNHMQNVNYYISNGIKYLNYTQFTFSKDGYSMAGVNGASAKLYFDYKTHEIYFASWGAKGAICDLDDLYPGWTGFTSNEVIMTITLDKPMLVSSVMGRSFTKGNDVDTDKPVIIVDQCGYDAYPTTIVGKAMPLFGAAAFDPTDGSLSVNVTVYENYNSPLRKLVKENATSFTPAKAGTYYIEYKATDRSGNEATEVFEVIARNASEFDDLSFTPTELPATEGRTLQPIAIPAASSLTGGVGKVTCATYVKAPGGEFEAVEESFIPYEVGTYTLRYVLTDYIGQTANFDYNVTIRGDATPYLESVTLPFQTVLSGSEITFPACKAYAFEDGAVTEIPVKIKVESEGTVTELSAPYTYIPSASLASSADLKVTYFASNDGGTTYSDTYTVKVVNPYTANDGTFELTKFFAASESVTVTQHEMYMGFTSVGKGNASFINKLLAKYVSMQFAIPKDTSLPAKVTLTLTDSLDASNQIKISFESNGAADKCNMRINGGEAIAINGSWGTGSLTNIAYSDVTRIVSDGGNVMYTTVNENAAGKPFNGFKGDYVYVNIEIDGTDNGSEFNLYKLNAQAMSDVDKIRVITAEYESASYIPSEVVLGDTFVVPHLSANHPLFGLSNIKVTVTVGGSKLIDAQTVVDNLRVTVDQNKNYSVKYEAETAFGKTVTVANYLVHVNEYEKPVITVKGNVPTSARKGEKISLPSASATDNLSGSCNVLEKGEKKGKLVLTVYVIDPDRMLTDLYGNDLTFTPTKSGTYKVFYYAYDENYNFEIKTFEIAVA